MITKKCRLSILLLVSLLFIIPTVVHADNSQKLKKAQPAQRVAKTDMKMTSASSQTQLNPKLVPGGGAHVGRGSGMPGDIPGRNSHYMGWQGTNLGGIKAGPTTSQQTGDKFKAPAAYLKEHPEHAQGQTMTVQDMGKQAQMQKLFNPARGVDLPDGKSLGSTESQFGAAKLPGGGNVIPSAEHATVEKGAGKNIVSREEMQSDVENKQEIAKPAGSASEKKHKDPKDMSMHEKNEWAKEHASKEPATPAERPLTVGRIWADISHAVGGDAKFERQPWQVNGAPGSRGTPTPDAVDNSHVPSYLQAKPKEIVDPNIAKKRQVSLENENKRHLVPENIRVTNQDIINRTTSGKIDYGPEHQESTGPVQKTPWKPVNTQPKPGTEPGGGDGTKPD